ncbi:dephospho-CoA kinase [Dongia sp.]|uniref:dephospho-CoA kinase n=1 Tax=Dongia sp. TaxID=1977262 RepID=UPI0035AF7578
MHILGLTGSIGMGKSTAAAMLRALGLPVHDADAAVHRLLAKGGKAVAAVGAAFPGVVADGAVDRKALGALVFGKPAQLKRLEAILHPLVRRAERDFLAQCRQERHDVVVLDIPLLFETGGEKRCDGVVVVTAPQFLQTQRVMKRPGMTRERFRQILQSQMPDAEKRRRADWVVDTGLGRRPTLAALGRIVRELKSDRFARSR